MNTTRNLANSLLNESFGYDFSEECAGLLLEWYGDDLSSFDLDDEDLEIAFGRLRTYFTFWRTGRYTISPYQKLRLKYDALLESYLQMIDDYRTACSEKEQAEKACQVRGRKTIMVKVKGGCSHAKERRSHKIEKFDVA